MEGQIPRLQVSGIQIQAIRPGWDDCRLHVIAATGMDPADLGARRDQVASYARTLACWIGRDVLSMSYPEIALHMGDERDHSFAIYAARRGREHIPQDHQQRIREQLHEIATSRVILIGPGRFPRR